MNKEQLNKLEEIRQESSSPSRADKWTKDLALFYYNLFNGNEKGIYGMKDKNGDIVYVGESIDMTYRMWEHFHKVRDPKNLKHNISDSFYKHSVPQEDINFENAKDFLAQAREEFTPVCLWAQEDDSPRGNLERLVMEHELIEKYKPHMNYNLVLPIVTKKRTANKFTNENGRYE